MVDGKRLFEFYSHHLLRVFKYSISYLIVIPIMLIVARNRDIPLVSAFLLILIVVLIFWIPAIILLVDYYKNSKGKSLEVGWQELVYDSGGIKRQINKEEIESIHKLTSRMSDDAFEMAFTPWGAGIYYCYIIRLKMGDHIYIPNLLDDSEESLGEQLSRFTDEIKTIRRMWPWIQKVS